MENREQQILSEIKAMMSSIRGQLEKLDAKMAELQNVVDPEDAAAMPIDLDIEGVELSVEETGQEVELELEVEEKVEEEVEEVEEVEEEVEVVEEEVELIPEKEVESVDIEPEDDDDLPLFAEPEPVVEAVALSPKSKKVVKETRSEQYSWKTDIPGAPVRDILSAISLNDRVQFINVLFHSDPSQFQQARARINSMDNLDQVIEYIESNFDWDMDSQAVYRFMMAVRRKVN